MHLINILVIAVSILTILSALALVFGSSKSERRHSFWFLAAAVGEVLWGVSIAVALSLPPTDAAYAAMPWLLKGIYVGAILMDSTILGYVSWKYKFGKILTTLFLAVGAVLSTIFLYDPSVLYTEIVLAGSGNYITINTDHWFYAAYIVYFCTIVPAFCLSLVYRIRHASKRDTRKGYLFFLVGLAIAGFFSLVFDLIMPLTEYSLIWVGPLLIGLTMLGFYYAVLRYRMISLSTGWLKTMSSIVIISSALIVYLLIFHLIFSALFNMAAPSFQVILLNFIMIAIAFLLMPAISEMFAMTRSLILTKQIDIAYIVKKLTHLNQRKLNLKDISGFLAEHMHFTYVGFLVNGRYYVEDEYKIPIDDLATLPKLPRPERGIWQNPAKLSPDIVKKYNISRIATLVGGNGEILGQLVLGKPTTKSSLDRKDLTEIEMIISLMAVLVENGSRKS